MCSNPAVYAKNLISKLNEDKRLRMLQKLAFCKSAKVLLYPAICRVVRPTSQNSVKAKNLGGDQLPVKARLVKVNNQWG